MFDSLAVAVRGEGDRGRLAAALSGLGALDDAGENVFLEPAAFAALAGARADEPEWRAKFDGMIAYAASKGWTDERGRVQAHVERPG